MNEDSRPVNLDLGKMAWPVTAIASILHRIAGGALFVAVGFMLYALELSLTSEAEFLRLKAMMSHPVGMFITWGILAALGYHLVAGIKHLLLDFEIGDTLEGATFGARVTLLFGSILILLAAIWVLQS